MPGSPIGVEKLSREVFQVLQDEGPEELKELLDKYPKKTVAEALNQSIHTFQNMYTLEKVEGYTCLHLAAYYTSVPKCDVLCERGANVNGRTANGLTPLHAAAAEFGDDACAYLVSQGADVNARDDKEKETPMDLLWKNAARFKGTAAMSRTVMLLADHGAAFPEFPEPEDDSPSAKTATYQPFLFCMANPEHFSLVAAAIVVKGGYRPPPLIDGGPMTYVMATARKGMGSALSALIDVCKHNADVTDSSGRSPLHFAAAEGHTGVVSTLIRSGLAVRAKNNKGSEPLHFAAKGGHHFVVAQLLEAGADPSAKNNAGSTPLHIAAKFGHRAVGVNLLEAGADPNARSAAGDTALSIAMAGGHAETAEALLDAGGDIMHVDPKQALTHAATRNPKLLSEVLAKWPELLDPQQKLNALHQAIQSGLLSCVQVLLKAGASLDEQDDERKAPLHVASEVGSETIVQVLLDAGADPNAHEDGYDTPLHLAAARDHLDVMRLLIAAGANVEAQGDMGHTPIYGAGARACKLLIQNDADPQGTESCRPALWYACAYGWTGPAALMLQAGALACNCDDISIPGLMECHEKGVDGDSDACLKLLLDAAEPDERKYLEELLGLRLTRSAVVQMFRYAHDAHKDATAVHIAAAYGRPLQLEVSLERGKHAGALDLKMQVGGAGEAMTALEAARFGGHDECVKLLEEAAKAANPKKQRKAAGRGKARATRGRSRSTSKGKRGRKW